MSSFLSFETLHLLNVQIPEAKKDMKIVKAAIPKTRSSFIVRCTICDRVLETSGFFLHLLRHINRSTATEKKRAQRQKLRDSETEGEATLRKAKYASQARERRKVLREQDDKDKLGTKKTRSMEKLRKNHVCSICGKKVQDAAYLKVHERLHEGTKEWSCDECGKSFTQKVTLLTHKRDTHSNDLNHQCLVCKKRFKHRSNLRIHKKEHEDPQSKRCIICEKEFSTRFGVLQHHRRHHQSHKSFEL